MIELEHVPYGLAAIQEYYGNPDKDGDGNFDTAFWAEWMESYVLPFPMRASWDAGLVIQRQWIHRNVGPAMIDALSEIASRVPSKQLQLCNCDRLGGVFNFRRNRRSGTLSTHSWGIAIDINPHLGPLGGASLQPDFIVEAFTERGFVTFPDDGMHFQACDGY